MMAIFDRKFLLAKFYDFGATAPILILFGLALRGLLPQLRTDLSSAYVDGATLLLSLSLIVRTGTIIYMSILIFIFVVRRLPIAKLEGVWPRILAVVSADLNIGVLALPKVQMTLTTAIASSLLSALGTVATVLVLIWLGRSFSILPQARKLVTSGPYKWIRHPLYLSEQIAVVGIMLQFMQPWALLMVASSLALQLWRMRYEERILKRTFPAYSNYAAHTARLIPGVY
jgi:protein-S-isoprenylcysteine O-methyltransferase Ste14